MLFLKNKFYLRHRELKTEILETGNYVVGEGVFGALVDAKHFGLGPLK